MECNILDVRARITARTPHSLLLARLLRLRLMEDPLHPLRMDEGRVCWALCSTGWQTTSPRVRTVMPATMSAILRTVMEEVKLGGAQAAQRNHFLPKSPRT